MTRASNVSLQPRWPVVSLVRRSIASRLRGVILPLCLALVRPQLECWVQIWAPQYERDMDVLERVQQRATKTMKDRNISPIKKG